MGNEIERKFLVDNLPLGLDDYISHEISQGYLEITSDVEKRVRKEDKEHIFTVKGIGGLKRPEKNKKITRQRFEALWPRTKKLRIFKTRYYIPYLDLVVHFDVYSGNLEGLMIAEVEFETEKQAQEFIPLGWFGREVTYEERLKNKNLARYGLPKDLAA